MTTSTSTSVIDTQVLVLVSATHKYWYPCRQHKYQDSCSQHASDARVRRCQVLAGAALLLLVLEVLLLIVPLVLLLLVLLVLLGLQVILVY